MSYATRPQILGQKCLGASGPWGAVWQPQCGSKSQLKFKILPQHSYAATRPHPRKILESASGLAGLWPVLEHWLSLYAAVKFELRIFGRLKDRHQVAKDFRKNVKAKS